MINVLELIDGGFLGGGQTHILSLIKNLDTEKYYAIISASPNGMFKELVNYSNHKFEDITLPKIFRTKYLKRLDEIVKKNNIQIIHSHGGVAGMYARFYKKRFGNIRIVHTIHGIHYIHSRNIVRNVFSKTIEQHLVPFTDAFICVSDEDKKTGLQYKLINEEKSYVVKNGIDVTKFIPLGKSGTLMKKYGISKDDLVIGNISRFDYQKNQKLLLKVIKEILFVNDKIKILFVGSGKYLKDCKFLAGEYGIKDKVIFTGEISDVEHHYPLIDIFVFPTLWEGFSITLIEAMSSGKFIIASDIPQNKELIEDGKNGILFKSNDATSLFNKIMLSAANDELRSKLSLQALKDSRKYKDDIMTKEIEKVYEKLFH